MPSTWIVVPAYNEAENLAIVIPQIVTSLESTGEDFRVLVVDDGSSDGTARLMAALSAKDFRVATSRLKRNEGKASALRKGFEEALAGGASTLVMMDADGQDDPTEAPRLLGDLSEGWSLVTGARIQRQDRFIKRTTSRLYNRVTGLLSGAPGRDFNSGFKAMSADLARELVPMLYGEMHRYITVIAYWRGYRITESEVAHHPRLSGSSKYGLERFWRGFIDLLTIRFLMSYEQRPSHMFSAAGACSGLLGALLLGWLLIEQLQGGSIGDRPALIAGVLLLLGGLQLFLFGLLAELLVFGRHSDRARRDNQASATVASDGS